MKALYRLAVLATWLALCLTIGITSPVFASTGVNIGISPATLSVVVGSSFSIDLAIETSTSVRGWQANLDFDASRLVCTSLTEGGFLKSYAQAHGNTGLPDNTYLPSSPVIDNVGGHIRNISYAIMGGAGGPAGTGVLCTLTFSAKAAGAVTLTPTGIIVSDVNGFSISSSNITITPGNVTIGNSTTTIPPIPTSPTYTTTLASPYPIDSTTPAGTHVLPTGFTATPAVIPTPTPAPDTDTPLAASADTQNTDADKASIPKATHSLNWGLLGGIAAAAIALGFALYINVARRKHKK